MSPCYELPCYEIDTPCILAHQQPAALIDIALARGIDDHKLLRGTGIFYDDILAGNLWVSAQQCYQLISNTRRLHTSDDISFLSGHRLFPGNHGAVSTALMNARDLQQALELLQRYRTLLTPLIAPRLHYDEDFVYIYWQDTCGAGTELVFLTEMISTALSSLCRWLSGRTIPWRFYFSQQQPRYIEQYQVNLGDDLHFDSHMDAMVISRNDLHVPWPNASPSAIIVAQREADAQLQQLGLDGGFLERVYLHLLDAIQRETNLDQVAADFAMSSATLKRKLVKHGSHFQAQYDLVRKHLALYLINRKGWTNEQVASHLHFHDANNLRRAFKRWTGVTPAAVKALAF
jgi:AraC-like DNA-binding protein